MLVDILKQNKCFKLVCGAGNENIEEVERLVYVYSKAGCVLFDLSANLDVIKAAKRGIEKSGIQNNRYICVSIGIKGDPHTYKAIVDKNLCNNCGICQKFCPQNAIHNFYVDQKSCIGCRKCIDKCPKNAINLYSGPVDINNVLPVIIHEGVDCIEYHSSINDNEEVLKNWEIINTLYSGLLSICIDRSQLGNIKYIERIKSMLELRSPYTTIIQADGIPMSGGEDDFKTTLQAVAAAQIVKNENLPVFIMLSGGTNSKTKELANLCDINPNGIAIGSYARKIVQEYITRDDFYINQKINNQAVNIAKNLISYCV